MFLCVTLMQSIVEKIPKEISIFFVFQLHFIVFRLNVDSIEQPIFDFSHLSNLYTLNRNIQLQIHIDSIESVRLLS